MKPLFECEVDPDEDIAFYPDGMLEACANGCIALDPETTRQLYDAMKAYYEKPQNE